jgi:hypothetical protein
VCGVSALGAFTSAGVPAVAFVVGDTIRLNGVNFTVTSITTPIVAGTSTITAATVVVGPAPAVAMIGLLGAAKVVKQGLQVMAKVWTPTLSSVTVKAHSIEIYKDFPTAFFNAYTAYHYGGPNINAPDNADTLFIPFCLYPGTYQPSGHINVSRAREFYLAYTSSVFASSTGKIYVVASCLNFLLISDGSAVLRYST